MKVFEIYNLAQMAPGEDIDLRDKGLTSLKSSPRSVSKSFWCGKNKLKSLVGGPTSVGGNYECDNNLLMTLEGAPKEVVNFECMANLLTTLEGGPEITKGDYRCNGNRLVSLKGAPKQVDGMFDCSTNSLASLEHAPSIIGSHFYCVANNLDSLKDVHKYIKKINGEFDATSNPIKSHILGVLLIDGVTNFYCSNNKLTGIMNRYLPNKEGMNSVLDCQEALIAAGYEEYAQL